MFNKKDIPNITQPVTQVSGDILTHIRKGLLQTCAGYKIKHQRILYYKTRQEVTLTGLFLNLFIFSQKLLFDLKIISVQITCLFARNYAELFFKAKRIQNLHFFFFRKSQI